MSQVDLQSYRDIIVVGHPELANASFTALTRGFHSIAIDVDDRLIFKFPRHEEAALALRREARLLAAVRPRIALTVPDLVLHERPTLYSEHVKLKGEHLLSDAYGTLPDTVRQQLAETMARFYADVHVIDPELMRAAGALPLAPWLPAEQLLAEAWPLLPDDLRPQARKAVDDWQRLSPDPAGMTYGFFDGHGWNMAFDPVRQQLNGIYDFADSGFGPLHQEFIYTSFISLDLTARVIDAYERMTGCDLDRQRIHLLTGVYWISEVGGFADDPAHLSMALDYVRSWVSAR